MNKHFLIQRKVLISMLFVAASMLGYISWKQLNMEIFPNAELPMLYIQVNSRIEVTPEYMEQEAIIPVESMIAGLENIEEIQSSAGRRRGSILISYEERTNLKYAYLKLDEQVSTIRGDLSDEFSLQVVKIDLDQADNTLMSLQARGSGGVDRVRNYVDQHILNELENIEGVAAVNVFGGKQKSVDIILDRAACEAYNIAPSRVRNILSSNMNMRQYGGTVREQGNRFFVYLNTEYDNILQIEDLIIGRGKNPVKLKDIAEIYYGEKEEETISRVNGKDAVSMELINDAQANIINLSHNVEERLAELNIEGAPFDIEVIIQENSAELMEDNINQIIRLALIGGFLAIFVLWVFLRNVRLVLLVALAMPISIFAAFNFFFGFDISINSLTLIGIALAIGMLLDTSVVVLENIYRLRSLGVKPAEAVVRGTGEVWRSIVAATATTIAVFIPFIFANDFLIRLLSRHIGVSIISTLSVSLFVSLLLIPMAVHVLISRRKTDRREVYQEVSLDNRLVRIYLSLLKTALRNPAPTIIGVLILFFGTILTTLSVSVNKLSELETDRITLYVTMPTGTTLEATDALVAGMEEALMTIEEHKEVISRIQEEEASVSILLQENYRKIKNRSFGQIQSLAYEMVKDLPASDISLTASSSGAGKLRSGRGGGNNAGSAGFEKLLGIGEDEEYIVLRGQDFGLLVEVGEDLQSYLDELDNIRWAKISVRENQPEVHLDFNALIMDRYGITRKEVLNELSSFTSEISSGVNFSQDNEEYEIIIKYDDALEEEDKDKRIEDLRGLGIPDSDDENLFELQEISQIYYARGLREISRVNQDKQVELRYAYNKDVYDSNDLLEYARSEIEDLIQISNIPTGVAVELVQEDSGLEEFKYMFLIAILLVYMILAAIFESFVTPFVLLFSIPLAAIGSFFLLTVTGESLFNANTIMGFLILLGVVVNNGIILIDFINVLRKRGYRKQRALLMGGLSRVRPILITAVTTCAAMIPLAMGDAEYVKAIGPPFAITVIGGLSLSTLLTLVYIPMLYNGIEQALAWIREQKLVIKLVMLIFEIAGMLLVVLFLEKFIWKMAAGLLVIVGIPVVWWFISNSLRKASERIIDEENDIHIQVSNLVKIYGRDSRMVREFRAGGKIARVARSLDSALRPRLEALIWQLPLLAFLVYFSWFYLVSAFWQLLASALVYYYLVAILVDFGRFTKGRWLRVITVVIRFAAPLLFLVIFQFRWDNLTLTFFAGFLWYLLIAMKKVSKKVKTEDFHLKKQKTLFRWFYWFVSVIPGLGKRKEPFKALKGVSLEIGTGMFGLLGPNGAGKSTMIRIICGILEQSYGKIWINGIDTQEKREELQGLIGYLPQEFGMYENMSSYAYLDYQAILKGITDTDKRKKRIREVLDSVHMWDQRHKKIGAYSGGMKQRIGIAQVLLHLPRILVVDEPTAGLDPRERIRFRNLLVELSATRVVIFSTHIIEDISSSCNTMAVINRGEVLFNGTPGVMTGLARGKVWKSSLPAEKFEEATSDMLVVHHMRDGEQIRFRCIAAEKPFTDAVEESPLLEDAYLWLLRNEKQGRV
ncbi:MAG: ATP-binding cassette domain-containing protein [Bacteroidetes bacterium]|nr:ATP-binding cassette domain-containing protein [Bacteroidota bacterium]